MKLAIFAKKGTNEKVLLPVPKEFIGEAMNRLNKQFGDGWVFVDSLHGNGEFIKFTDDMVYMGYTPKIERYSSAIKKLES